MFNDWLAKKIDERQNHGLLRKLPVSNTLVDFTSNDYLGFARSTELAQLIDERSRAIKPSHGSTGSRLLSGNHETIVALENKLARIFNVEATLTFNSGYAANLAVLSALPQRNDTVLYDELSHASIKDGIRLGLGRRIGFRHNDIEDLEKKIARSSGRIFVVVESLYSMDGDECPLRDLVGLKKSRDFVLILDEAHSTGVRGEAGAGLCAELNLTSAVDIRIHTFGKAMGVCGACVAGSEELIKYLVNFSRPFIYTTAPSPHSSIAIAASFDFLKSNMNLQEDLKQVVNVFLKKIGELTNRTDSFSAIQTLIAPGNERVRMCAAELQRLGFDVRPILSPTVPQGKERLRICLHAFNTEEEINNLSTALHQMMRTNFRS